jgi:aryl-alcohol dehydrogenase-like predicted oxidoreductase
MKRRMFLQGVGAAAAVPLAGCSGISHRSLGAEGKIRRSTLGKTGIKVSMLGFGSHLIEELKKDPVLRDRMIRTGYEGGINIFDVYEFGGYKQFEPMGKSLEGIRKNVVVSLCLEEPDEKIEGEISDALTKFKTDYIDCYRLYVINDTRVRFLEDARKAGKVRAIGMVAHDTAAMMRLLDQYGDVLDYVMIPFNFHHNNAYFMDAKNYAENDYSALIPRCEKMGLGIMGIKCMGSGHMIDLAVRENMLRKNGLNLAQAMLRYVFQFSEVDIVMPTFNTMEEVKEGLDAAHHPALSAEEKDLLAQMSAKAAATKRVYLPGHYKWLENWATGRVV